jgi:hypothetical protein
MARYAAAGNKGTASVRTIVVARADGTAAQRGRVYDYMVGALTTPADNVFDHELYRTSTAGTGAALTLQPLDPAESAAIADGGDTFTADPTIGTVLFRMPLNHRAAYRWVAAPGGELVWPATTNNGIGGGLASASTTDFSATLHVDTA